jgi:phosphotriesterase-related protein
MPAGQGRDVSRQAEISRRTGVHVVACTGLHTEKYYEDVPWALRDPAAALVERFTAVIVGGADGTDHRCGVIKVATGPDRVTVRARRLFAAAAETHRRTGAPLLTHCEEGQGAMEQVRLLAELEVPLPRVLLSHTDKVPDPGYHRDLLATGVNLEYDQALRQPADEAHGTAWLTATMVDAGYGDQLMLGTDGARRTLWTAHGGSPGLAWMLTGYRAALARHGLDDGALETILVANPARWLTFDPS